MPHTSRRRGAPRTARNDAAARQPHQPPAGGQPKSGANPGLTKPKREVDDQQFFEGTERMIRQLGIRAGKADASVLKDLLSLHAVIDEAAANAAYALNAGAPGQPPLSWGTIASELGVTRQAAWQAWGKVPA